MHSTTALSLSLLLTTATVTVQGSLKSYNHYDNVWRFDVNNATLKLTSKAQGPLTTAPKLTTDKIKIICVDAKLCSGPPSP